MLAGRWSKDRIKVDQAFTKKKWVVLVTVNHKMLRREATLCFIGAPA